MAVIIAKSTDTGSTLPVAAGVHWDVYASDAVDSFSIAAGADAIFNVSKGDDKYTLAGSPSDYTVKRSGSFSTDMVFTHIATGKSVTVFVNNEADTLNFGNGATAPIALVNGAVVLGSGTPKAQTVTTTAAAITGFSGGTDTATYTLAVTPGTSITEGQTAVFTITADKALTTDTDLSYSIIGDTLNSTATAATGADYAPSSGTIKILAGQTTASVSVLINSDAAVEGAEGMKFNLMNPANFAVYASQLVMILDDSSVGQTYTLTTARDVRTGTNGDDIFDGSLSNGTQTLNSFDELDGGLGNNTLYATLTSSATPAKLANMQQVNITNTTAANVLGLQNAAATTHLTNVSSTADLTFSSIQAVTTNLSINNISTAGIDTTYAYAVTTGTETVNLTLDNVNDGAAGTLGLVTIAGIENLNITSGNGSTLANEMELDASGATTAVVTGAANLTLDFDTALDSTVNLTKVDASAMTGGLTLLMPAQTGVATTAVISVTGGSAADTLTVGPVTQVMTINGAAGNDTISRTANLTVNDTIDGGDGTDALVVDDNAVVGLTATTAFSKITNIETLRITDAGGVSIGSGTYTLSRVSSGITAAQFDIDTAAGGTTVVGGTTGDLMVKIGAGSTDTTTNLGSAFTVSNAGTGATDTLTISNNASAINAFSGQNLAVSGYETLVLNTSGFGAATAQTTGTIAVTGSLGATSAETVKFTGSNTIAVAAITADIIDASGLTATGTAAAPALDMVTASTATTITGSAGFDDLHGHGTLASSVNGGAGNDTITGGTGNDNLIGGDGVDSITGGTGTDSIDAGAGNDTVIVTLATGNVINGGEGTDALSLAAAATAATATGVSNFETLTATGTTWTQDMVLFVGNTGFTTVNSSLTAGGNTLTINNASSSLNTLNTTTGTTTAFARLVDTATDSLAVNITGGQTITAITASNEETISIASTDTNGATVTTLTDTDLSTLNITGSGKVTITTLAANSTTTGTTLTVNGSTNTGGIVVDAVSTTIVANMTGSATAANTIKGGAGIDTIVGGAAGDSLTNGTTSGGADFITGGGGADTFNLVKANSVAGTTASTGATLAGEAITITDFAYSSDILSFGAASIVTYTPAAAGTAAIAASGLATFNVADSTLAQRITAIAAAIDATGIAAGASAMFVVGSDSYVFCSDANAGVTEGDMIIKLTGLNIATHTLTAAGGTFTIV